MGAGYSIAGYDCDQAAMDRLGAMGAAVLSSALKVAQQCRRILFSLPAPAQVVATVEAIEPALEWGHCILDTTTGDPEIVESLAARFSSKGVLWLDCEIGGSSAQALRGEAIVICGGTEGGVDGCRDILDALSSRVYHTGPAGTGTRMKLALNIAIGLHRAVLAESLSFARANGIDPHLALTILKSGPAYSKAMDVKGSKMLSGDFTPEARLAQHLKDVTLIRKTGVAVGARLPLSELHEQLLREAVEAGLGGLDNSSIIRLFSRPE
jgi:3-hydroxyisobutyrate dehydrogenase-like beta-hydroxyacid dehydrogenase